MEKPDISDIPGINFNNSKEYENLSQDQNEGIGHFDSMIDFAISDDDADQELNIKLQHVLKISQSSIGLNLNRLFAILGWK